MRTPGPPAGVLRRRRFLVLVEAGEVHAPDVAVLRRQRAAVRARELSETGPGNRQLHRPAAVTVRVLVDGPVHVHGGPQPGKVPVPVADARPAGMVLEPD